MAVEVKEHPKGGWGVWVDGQLSSRTFSPETVAELQKQHSPDSAPRRGRVIQTGEDA